MFSTEGKLAGEKFVQDNAEGEYVRPVIDLFTHRLLGGHVRRRPDRRAGLCQVRCSLEFGKPKVHDLHLTLGIHHDVIRFDIPVDDSLLSSRRQAVTHLNGDIENILDGGYFFFD